MQNYYRLVTTCFHLIIYNDDIRKAGVFHRDFIAMCLLETWRKFSIAQCARCHNKEGQQSQKRTPLINYY